MRTVEDVLLGSDEGVLAVRSVGGPLEIRAWGDNTLVEVTDELAAAGELWVMTAHQWGPFSVTTQVSPAAPPEPGAEWEDVVEFSANSPSPLVVTELVENDPRVPFTDEPGTYRIRVSSRGRKPSADQEPVDDATEAPRPVEWYLLQAWPAPVAEPVVVRLQSSYARERLAGGPSPLRVPDAGAALSASGRIGRDVGGGHGARVLSGQTGAVEVARTIRGTRRKLFFTFAHSNSWSNLCNPGDVGWSYGGPGGPDYALGEPHYFSADEDSDDQLTGYPSSIRWSFTSVEKPARVVRSWNWVAGPWNQPQRQVRTLSQDTVVTTTLEQSKDDTGQPWATIRVRHEDLPVEWLEDMETWWSFQLAVADQAESGRG